MEINRLNVFEITSKAGLKPDKDYGQNFLLEPDICRKIVDAADIQKDDIVLEIGPGIGSLTHFISLSNSSNIDVVDIDSRMVDFLKVVYQDSNIKIILNDIRKHDVNKYSKIIGNLPYNITTETVTYLLQNAKQCKKMILMCQAEAFNRFFDMSGKEYGPVSILLHLLGSSKRLFSVKAGCFYPVPKCGSLVFSIDICPKFDFDTIYGTYSLTKSLFLNRRKTISNNLANIIKDKSSINSLLEKANISPTKRPEEVSPSQFVDLYEAIKNI